MKFFRCSHELRKVKREMNQHVYKSVGSEIYWFAFHISRKIRFQFAARIIDDATIGDGVVLHHDIIRREHE